MVYVQGKAERPSWVDHVDLASCVRDKALQPLTPCSTALHFVRCIKPNSQQVAGSFDAQLILHQLRCCGVLEVARIARAGYPTRYLHAEFAMRYKHLLPELGPGV